MRKQLYIRGIKKIDFKNFFDKIDANAYFIVAYDENVILGYAVLYANNLETKEAYITLLEVYRAYQGKHIGNGLIEKCERLAKEKKMTKIQLCTLSACLLFGVIAGNHAMAESNQNAKNAQTFTFSSEEKKFIGIFKILILLRVMKLELNLLMQVDTS